MAQIEEGGVNGEADTLQQWVGFPPIQRRRIKLLKRVGCEDHQRQRPRRAQRA